MSARLLVLLAFLLVGTAAAAADAPDVRVRYLSADAVYLDGGRSAGLAEGQRLRVMRGMVVVAELEVTFVAEHSASCRIVTSSGTIEAGLRAVRVDAPAAETTPEITVTDETPRPVASGVPAAADVPWAQLHGGMSAGWMHFADATEADTATGLLGTATASASRDLTETTARVDLDARGIAGGAGAFRLRGRLRGDTRTGTRGVILEESSRDDRLYEAAFRWEPPAGRFRGEIGRLSGALPWSRGILDGAMGEARLGTDWRLGAFAGRAADAGWFAGGSDETRTGAFVRLVPDGGARSDAALAFVHESAVDRLGLDGRTGGDGWWAAVRAELESADPGTRLTDVAADLRWQASPEATFALSYDRQRTSLVLDAPVTFEEALREQLRQGLRAGLEIASPGGFGFSASGAARLDDGADSELAWSLGGGVRHGNLLGLQLGADAVYATNPLTRSLLVTVRASHGFGGGHVLEAGYGRSMQELRDDRDAVRRTNEWLRLGGHAVLGRGFFARLELELSRGVDIEGTRVLAETGWRF